MQRSLFAVLAAAVLVVGAAKYAQTHAQAPASPGTPPAAGKSGVNVGSLNCTVAGGMGFIFGSSKDLDCLLVRTDGVAEHYKGSINKYGVDVGYHNGGVIVWAVFAPSADLAPGSLTGNYGGVTAGAAVGVGAGANALVGGSNNTVALQPVSIEGMTGLNVAAGVASISLTAK